MKQTKFLFSLLMAIVMMVGMLVPQGAWAENLWVDGVTVTISEDASYDEIEVNNGGFLIINEGVTLTVTIALNIHGDDNMNLYGTVINYGTIKGEGCINMMGGVLANHGHIDLGGANGHGTFTIYNTGTLGGPINLSYIGCDHDEYDNLGTVEATCTHGAGTQYRCKTCYYMRLDETSERSPHTFDNETDPHHTHCTECKHSWIYYTTTDGEDFEDFEYRFPNAFNHGFDSENNYYYIEFADAMTEITEFGYCEKLATIILPSTVTSIGNLAFVTCSSLNSIILPSSLESIGNLAFYQSGLTCITIPESVTSIGPGAFAYCESLTSFTAPCTLDLSNVGVPGNVISRVHDEESKRLTAEPVADGLYTYTCDKGCGHYDEHRFIKDFNGAGNHLELTTDGEGNYSTSENITLADANGFAAPVDVTATSVTFNRNIVKDGGKYSFIVPFDIPAEKAATLGKFYTFDKYEDETVYFAEETDVKANTAYFFAPKSDITSISLNDAEIKATTSMADATNPSAYGLYGTYKTIAVPEGAYGYASDAEGKDKFVRAGTGSYVNAFRCYLWLGSGASASKANAIFGFDEATGINAEKAERLDLNAPMYNLRGQRITSPQKGEIYIMDGKKVMFK